MIVAIGRGRVGLGYGVEIAVNGAGRLALVSICAAEDVVGAQLLVGRAVAVEVVGQRLGLHRMGGG